MKILIHQQKPRDKEEMIGGVLYRLYHCFLVCFLMSLHTENIFNEQSTFYLDEQSPRVLWCTTQAGRQGTSLCSNSNMVPKCIFLACLIRLLLFIPPPGLGAEALADETRVSILREGRDTPTSFPCPTTRQERPWSRGSRGSA